MSLKKNILASYASQIYVLLISIIMVPLYIKYMGVEAYGLVGFFSMLQAWFQILDMGLTPTMARETARFRGGAVDALSLRSLLRAMESIFIGVAILGCALLMFGSGVIASSWLKVNHLSLSEVQRSILLMSVIVALRWVSGLYRGLISGSEQLVWLGSFNSILATARFVMVIPYFMYVGTTPTEFFIYQLALALMETVLLVLHTYRWLPKIAPGQGVRLKWESIRGPLGFSVTISFASLVWVLTTQVDKLALSKLLSLTEYGHFTLVAMVAGGVVVIANPISSALLPRLTKLSAEGNQPALAALYRGATQLAVVVVVPVTLVLAFFSDQVLWVWTGDSILVAKVAAVLTLYAVGSGLSVLGAFPYYLQYADGKLRLHLVGNFLFILIFVPTLVVAIAKMGMIGAGVTWLIANLLYLLLWTPVVYRSFAPGLYWTWLIRDILVTGTPAVFSAWLIFENVILSVDRVTMGFQLFIIGLLLFFITLVSSAEARLIVVKLIFFNKR